MREQKPLPQKLAARLLRPLLVVNTAVFVCLTLLLYFLTDCGFFTGAQTLSARAEENLIRRESETAVQYLRACMPNDPTQIDMAQITAFREYFRPDNNNFFFFFWQKSETQAGQKVPVLNNYTAEHYSASFENYSAADFQGDKNTRLGQENEAFFQAFQGLSFDCYVREPLHAHDDFYRVQQVVRVWNILKYPLILFFLLSALLEGWLWVKLCAYAAKGLVSPALLELNGAPLYLLTLFYLGAMTGGLFYLHGQIQKLYDYITFADRGDIRAAIYLSALLLLLLAWMTTVFVSLLRARIASPQWFRSSALYRAVTTPSIERRLQIWLSVSMLTEAAIFLFLFLRLHIENGLLFIGIDVAICAVVLLAMYVQGRSVGAYIRATHRIAADKGGLVPTGDLQGNALEHVQNINFLSRSAGEQTQLRFVNESFSTKLIRSVSQNLRAPLTAVTAEAERLQSGTLNEAQTRDSIRRVNLLSQDLKKAIEDLLRIASASAEGNEAHLVPTDARLMIEQTVGEFYDRFRAQNIELVQQLPKQELQIAADGEYMWTVFESILQEFLLYAVPGTRVFLQAACTDNNAVLHFQGTMRPESDPAQHSLALPTAKVFTEKQGGVYHDTLAQDILTVELRFPLSEQNA